MNKRDVLRLLEGTPEEIDVEELHYRLYVLQKLEAAEADIQAGRVTPHDEVIRRSREWRK